MIKRTWRDWLFLAVLLVVYVVAAILIGIALAFGCPAPDPEAKPVVSLSRGELSMLARLAWAEARGEPNPYCSMLAVSAVAVNRMRTNPTYFGATITQVLTKPHAFSPFGRDDPQHRRMMSIDERDSHYHSALLAALAAVSGIDPTRDREGHGATYFYSGGPPRWSHGMAVTLRSGRHTFLTSRP